MIKLIKLIFRPRYAFEVIKWKLLSFIGFNKKVFINKKGLRADSDNGRYVSAVLKVLNNQRLFNNFKRSYRYRQILEHVSKGQGSEYLKILMERNDGILEKGLGSVLITDNVGNPIKYKYEGFSNQLSPTTLRYLKVSSDLLHLFGADLGKVAEIGCGYGGQALVNDELLNVKFAKLFDLPYVNQLIDRYLNCYLLKGSYITTLINNEMADNYDLVISNYAFSELPKKLQLTYIDKVLSQSKRGYLTMNSGLGGHRSRGKLTHEELLELLPEFQLIREEPLTSTNNYIIAWGFDKDLLDKYFKTISLNEI